MAELAGVAIRVGFTLVRVRVATVVLTLRLVGRMKRGGFRLPSKGRITGVKVLPGREKEGRPLTLDGRTILFLLLVLSSS